MAKTKNNKMIDHFYEKELGRYKKAVQTRDTIITELKEEIAGQYELMNILSAYIAVLLELYGCVPNEPDTGVKWTPINVDIVRTS